jgi:hypothetical protein
LLIDLLGIKSRDEAIRLTQRYFPKQEFKRKHKENLDAAFPEIP